MSELCRVRPLERNDVPYVVESWLGVLEWRKAIPHRSAVAKAAVRAHMHAARVAVACVPDDPDAILGFAVVASTGETLMAYTRSSARRLGICAELFRHLRKAP